MSEQPQPAERAGIEKVGDKAVTVSVNEKPVKLAGYKTTGKAIKDAAIEQGVAIKPDFVLFVVTGNKQHPVGDPQELTVHEGERFRAVAPDDNS